MTRLASEIEYFSQGQAENEKFWRRLGRPSFEGASVLDVGCGHGRMCVDVALAGAKRVVGVDLNPHLVEFARETLQAQFPDLSGRVEFLNIDLAELEGEGDFDYILSKDAFEHILDPRQMLETMGRRLKKGGRIFIGFGPLYNSHFGDHKRTKAVLPWAHVVLPDRFLLWRLNRYREQHVHSVQELGLNKYSLRDFRRLFRESSLSIVHFKVNSSERLLSRLFTLLSKIPGLEEYFSHNIYCILEKR